MSEPSYAVLTGDIVRSTRLSQGELELTRNTVISSANHLTDWLRVVTALCDALIAKWTTRQCEILRIAIDPAEPSQEEIAEILAVKRRTVAKTLERMGWAAIEETLATFEAADWGGLRPESSRQRLQLRNADARGCIVNMQTQEVAF